MKIGQRITFKTNYNFAAEGEIIAIDRNGVMTVDSGDHGARGLYKVTTNDILWKINQPTQSMP